MRPSREFFGLVFALLRIGAVPIVVDPGMGLANLKRCLGRSEPAAFIGNSQAQLGRQLLGWARTSLRLTINTGSLKLGADHTLSELIRRASDGEFPAQFPQPTDPAAIVFTSGSTGTPKGVVYTPTTFAAQLAALRATWTFVPGECELTTLPLLALFAPALRLTTVVPDLDITQPARANPKQLVAAIQAFECAGMFASPVLIERLGRHCVENSIRLPSLRRVISAGAPASLRSLQRFRSLLAKSIEIHTPLGSTEAIPITSVATDFLLGEARDRTATGAGVCVGTPVAGIALAVIRILDDPIAEWREELSLSPGEIGEIAVRGDLVSPGYDADRAANAAARIGAGWHRTGDLGWLDADGRVWFCGRKSQRVVTATKTLFTVCCEAVFNQHAGVYRTALVGVDSRPVLCVELSIDITRRARSTVLRELAELATRHAPTRAIQTFLIHSRFPVDVRHNAKILREQLGSWAKRQLRNQPNRSSSSRTDAHGS